MTNRLTYAAFVACAAVVIAQISCAKRNRRTADDTLVVLLDGRIPSIDPRFTTTSYQVKISRLVVPGLTTIDQPSLEPMPDLAERMTQVDDVTWDVALRDGVRFSDGTPVTAEDVVYTYRSVLDPEVNSPYRGGFAERFERVEQLDDRRVRFHLVKPLATILGDFEMGILSAAADRRGEIVGAGAYRVVSLVPERKIILERNPHYHGDPAEMPRLDVRTVLDPNARAIMLVGGSADMTQNGIRPDLVESIAQRSRIKVDSGPGVILTYLMMNNDDPILRDVRVRRAIAYGLDREQIIAAKFSGRATLATGMVAPTHWAYEGEVDRYLHDPARARALLDEAGYPDPDGPGGAPRLSLSYKTSADPFRLMVARVIASQLGDIGIAVTVRSFEFGTFFSDIKKGNYQLGSMQTAPITDPDYLYTYFHTVRIPTEDHPHTHNRWRYRSARVDELTMRGRSVVDRDARRELYSEVQKILARDVPIIPLWHEDNIAVMHVDVTGYQIFPSARFGGLVRTSK